MRLKRSFNFIAKPVVSIHEVDMLHRLSSVLTQRQMQETHCLFHERHANAICLLPMYSSNQ
uniref:Uncharacterized protein n=1 Tax=Populus trichocarpa TaxID=3694 RepID=A0A3N7FDP7_POPTR